MKQTLISLAPAILPTIAFAISELMALKPNWKYNGLLQGLLEVIKSKSVSK
jgi:hypothetical protein